jgi:hypothetical protein
MFEPQDHPDDFPFPGAPPTPPYDNAGWTLAYQMGVQFDRILDGFSGPFEPVTDWNVTPPAGTVTAVARPVGYFTSHRANDAFEAVNRLVAANEEVQWLTAPVRAGGKTYPAGTFYVPARGTTAAALSRIAAQTGVSFEATATRPAADALRLRQPRVALVDVYGGSMTAGWTRWILEQFAFTFDRVFVPRIDQGNLNASYDVLVFPNGVLPDPSRPQGGFGGGGGGAGAAPLNEDSIEASLPPEYRGQRGRASERTLAAVRQFIEAGGTVITIGSSSPTLARALELPVRNHLMEGGSELPRNKFYVPGSVLRAEVDSTHPLAAGLAGQVDVFYDNSPVFALGPDAAARGVKRVSWFGSKTPLRSGWAWGQAYLDGGATALEATVGKGRAFLFGPEILQRAQPHGTFKFLFNGIYYGPAAAQKPTS